MGSLPLWRRQLTPSHRPIISCVLLRRPELDDPEKPRSGVLLVLDFEKNGHYPGGSMSVAQAVAFVERIKERTGKYPGLYGSEHRLRQMLYGERHRSASPNTNKLLAVDR